MKGFKLSEILLLVIFLIVLLWIFASTGSDGKNETSEANINDTEVNYYESIEDKLQKKLSTIKGVGNVEIFISYESSGELIAARDEKSSNSKTTENDSDGGTRTVINTDIERRLVTDNFSGDSGPLVLKKLEPVARGVIVIAQGADNIMVSDRLLRAVTTALGIEADKVEIFAMEYSEGG